jgi:hypothetical protein
MTKGERVRLIQRALEVPRHIARLIVEAFEDPKDLPDDKLDALIKRLHGDKGFGLVEAIVASGIGLVIVGMLATFMLTMGRSAALLAKAHEQRALAEGRIARTLTHLDTPEAGVVVALDPSTPEDAPCRLYHVTTTDTFNKSYEAWASRGCVNMP